MQYKIIDWQWGKWLLHVYVIWMKLYVLIILLFWKKKEQSML